MNKVITIDLDNVLAKTTQAFLQYYEENYGKKVSFNEVSFAYFNENKQFDAVYGIEERRRVYRHFMWTTKFEVVPGAIKGVKELYDRWYILHVLTWRNVDQESLTHIRIEENFPDLFEDIHFSHASTKQEIPKWKICKSLWAILHIDDFIDFSLSIAKEWIPVYLFDKPWNQWEIDNSLIERVHGRKEIIDKVVVLK